jgi:hypothetical protein
MAQRLTVTSRAERPELSVPRRTMAGVTDEQPVLSVLDRLTAAGLSPERIEQHLATGAVTLDGVAVSDLSVPAPPPARVVIGLA